MNRKEKYMLSSISKEILNKVATLENRLKLSVNLNAFDKSLIVADLLGISKEDALNFIIDIRKKGFKKWIYIYVKCAKQF